MPQPENNLLLIEGLVTPREFDILPDESLEAALLRGATVYRLNTKKGERNELAAKLCPLMEKAGLEVGFLTKTEVKVSNQGALVEVRNETSWLRAVEEGIAQVMDSEVSAEEREAWSKMLVEFGISSGVYNMGTDDIWVCRVGGKDLAFSSEVENAGPLVEAIAAIAFVPGNVLKKVRREKLLVVNVVDLSAETTVEYLLRRENGGFLVRRLGEDPAASVDSRTRFFNIILTKSD